MIYKKLILPFVAVAAVLAIAFTATCAAPAAATTKPATSPATAPDEVKKISIGQAAILGVVEGITEYLPVSSTGHMILVSRWMGLSDDDKPTDATAAATKKKGKEGLDAFEIVIQLGAILAVLGLYRRRVGQMAQGLVGRNPDGFRLLTLLILAFMPAAVVGLLFGTKIKEHLFGPLPVAWALVVGGVLMIIVEHYCHKRRNGMKRKIDQVDRIMYWQAFVIGMAQCLAMWPGTSRSMITILAGLVVGLDMLAAAEFSFLLALPTLGAATMHDIYKYFPELMVSSGLDGLLVGMIVSGIVAAIAVKAFVKWLTRHGLMPFGVYRIILGIIVYILLVTNV